ncbi:hypothetical protein [Pseudonocardia sp. NPDC049635]|uniref:hypothetical protein n=1 Tax=Pseudonocardia sp. NPDC049635 TaxID=3155506 RepID=UPI0033C9A065
MIVTQGWVYCDVQGCWTPPVTHDVTVSGTERFDPVLRARCIEHGWAHHADIDVCPTHVGDLGRLAVDRSDRLDHGTGPDRS